MANTFRILHVDDDANMRDMVDRALGPEPAFLLLSCQSGEEALAVAPDWAPDLILSDPMMPDMDGTTLLARLRADPATAAFPVVFIAGRAQLGEIPALDTRGAAAVIGPPFDAPRLAECVRRHLLTIRLNAAGYDFSQRLRRDATTLTALRRQLDVGAVPNELQTFVHKLAGAAGVFSYTAISEAAAALEHAIIEAREGDGAPEHITARFDALLASIAQA